LHRGNGVSAADIPIVFPNIGRFQTSTWASWSERMTQISPMLAVSDASAAIEFYKRAFGATVLWHVNGGGHVVAGLAVDDARFFLASESPPHGTRGPGSVGFTTVRIELFVDDPGEVHDRAVAAGASNHSPVQEHAHTMTGPRPIRRTLQGAIVDPFGHMWLVGKILE
jgi:PhnB protein